MSDLSKYYEELSLLGVSPSDEKYTEWSEWSGCPKEGCGFIQETRTRFKIPSIYGGSDMNNLPSNIEDELIETRSCFRYCRTEADVLSAWRKYTGCSSVKLPEVTKDKMISYIDENNKLVEFESAVWIDNLRYYSDSDLLNVFNIWRPVTVSDTSAQCYGNELLNNTTVFIGSKIFSKNNVGYIEYSTDGSFCFYTLNIEGDVASYKQSGIIRNKPLENKKGNYAKIVDNKLNFYSFKSSGQIYPDSSSDVLLESVNIGGTNSKIMVADTGLLVIDSNNHVINRVGNTQTEYDINSEITFKSDQDSEYYILKNTAGDSYLSISNKGVKLVNIVDGNAKIIWNVASDGVSCSITFNSTGIKINDSIKKELYSMTTEGCSKICLYGKWLELYSGDDMEYLCGRIGESTNIITEDFKIKKPTMQSEEFNCRFEYKSDKDILSQLVYQSNGDLVFKVAGNILWNSGTSGKLSTHFMISKGELFIMNKDAIVFRTNTNVNQSHITAGKQSFLLIGGDWLFILTQSIENNTDLELVKMYPNVVKKSDKGWSSINSLGKYFLEFNYNNFPSFVLKSKNHNNTGVSATTSLIDISKYLNVTPDSKCPPLDLFCNENKKEIVSSSISKFSVELNSSSSEWTSAVKSVSLSSFKPVSVDFNDTNTYLYSGRRINGYSNFTESEDKGKYSSPLIFVKNSKGSYECDILIKQPIEEFVIDYVESPVYEDFIYNLSKDSESINKLITDMTGFKLHSGFTFTNNNISSFSDSKYIEAGNVLDNIIEERVNVLEVECGEDKILEDKCINAFSKLLEKNERAKKFHELTINIECRKHFNHPACSEFIKSNNKVVKFIDGYCKKIKNMYSKDCSNLCSSSSYYLFSVCEERKNIYIFSIVLVLVAVLSFRRVFNLASLSLKKVVFRKNTNAVTNINNSIISK